MGPPHQLATTVRREFSLPALLLGTALSVVMGAANVYLGLRAGMTVSASIPAAVIAMGILQGVLRRRSLLESNLVQTAASAGESLAAGIIFTVPALILVGVWRHFDFWITTLVAFSGGLLGVLLMIPMRRVFVVENTELKFPEGVACAEVLRAGQGGSAGGASVGARLVFGGIAVGAVLKFCGSFLGLLKNIVEWGTYQFSRVFYFGCDVSPALMGVGFIVGLPIAVQIFLGGAIGWLIAIPILSSGDSELPAIERAAQLWASQVRYMGVGAMAVGGVVSIWRVRAGLGAATRELADQFRRVSGAETDRSEINRNISGRAILGLATLCIILIGGLYYTLLGGAVDITILATLIMIVVSFFFAAVASYLVGLVGNSNSPVSGMTITAVLATGGLLALCGYSGTAGIVATLGVAGIVCCVACTSGDVCNDLKTGYLVGASPRYQQIMQVLGVLVAAFVMAPVLTVLHEGSLKSGTGGIGGRELPAPQAVLFSSLADGFFGTGKLPWDMIGYGVAIGVVLLSADGALARIGSRFRLHIMPVAVGIYLPLGLSVPILLGGIVHALVGWSSPERAREENLRRGILVSSGIIAGESIVGVLLGFLAYMEIPSLQVHASLGLSETLLGGLSVLVVLAVGGALYLCALRTEDRHNNEA